MPTKTGTAIEEVPGFLPEANPSTVFSARMQRNLYYVEELDDDDEW